MIAMRKSLLWCSVAVYALAFGQACSDHSLVPSGTILPQSLTLDGQQAKVIAVRKRRAPNGGTSLWVDYTTRGATGDLVPLAREAREIWPQLQKGAEQAGSAAVLVRRLREGAKDTGGYFAFIRRDDGTWDGPQVWTLPDGRQIVVVAETWKEVVRGRRDPYVEYVTQLPIKRAQLPIKDMCSLASEVDDVWPVLRPAAETAGARMAYVVPTDAPFGGTSISFSFVRTEHGDWRRDRQDCTKQ
jgi:hypothetical protein